MTSPLASFVRLFYPPLRLAGVALLSALVLPVAGYTPTSLTWNPPGDTYGAGSPSNQGVSIPSPYQQHGFTLTFNGYVEEDSHTLAWGTHWSGQVGVNFVRGPQAPDNTSISFARSDGSEFWLNQFAIDLDGTSTKTISFQGFRDGEAVTRVVTLSGLTGGSNYIQFADPAFGRIDELRLTAAGPIRGFQRAVDYHPEPLTAEAGLRLSPGDIAIIGVSSIHSDFAFIALADLPGDHVIYFTTAGWNAAGEDWIDGNSGTVGNGYASHGFFWKTPGAGVPAGTIISYLDAPGQRSHNGVWFSYDENTWFLSDQVLVYELETVESTSPQFLYAANFSDVGQNVAGFQTAVGSSPATETALPAGLTAAASGQTGSAFGLAPTSGYDVALKTNVLVDGMTREQVLQAIHTPSNWETYSDEEYAGLVMENRYPAAITLLVPDLTPPTVVSIERLEPLGQRTNAGEVVFRVTFSESVTGVDNADFQIEPINGGSVTGTISVSGTGATRDVTVTVTNGTGEFTLRIAD